MTTVSYEGPRNGDYVTYVDNLLRASPVYRSSQMSIASALFDATSSTPGMESASPMSLVREKLKKAHEQALAAQAAAQKTAQKSAQASRATPAGQMYEQTSSNASRASAQSRAKAQSSAERRAEAVARETAQGDTAATKRPWVSPFMLFLIIGGLILSKFVPGVGVMMTLLGLFTAVRNVLSKLQGK